MIGLQQHCVVCEIFAEPNWRDGYIVVIFRLHRAFISEGDKIILQRLQKVSSHDCSGRRGCIIVLAEVGI